MSYIKNIYVLERSDTKSNSDNTSLRKKKRRIKIGQKQRKKSAVQWYDTRYARRKHSLAYYLRS